MATHKVKLLPEEKSVEVPTGTLITEAAISAGLEITQPCGGQGRCGRCAVKVESGAVRRRSTIRLNTDDLESGWALACQSLIEGDAVISIPDQERIERRLVTEHTARAIELPFDYAPERLQSIQTHQLSLNPPSLDDSQDDLSRLRGVLRELGYDPVEISLPLLQRIGSVLRGSDWKPHVLLDAPTPGSGPARLIEIGASPFHPHGVAVDIGTTTVTAYLVDLVSGKVKASAAEYNGQIARGEDVISRIIYAGKGDGLNELGILVRETIQDLLEKLQRRTGVPPDEIFKVTVAGNTTMIHLFLRLPPETIRLTPYIPAVNHPPRFLASDLDPARRRLVCGRGHQCRCSCIRTLRKRRSHPLHRRRNEWGNCARQSGLDAHLRLFSGTCFRRGRGGGWNACHAGRYRRSLGPFRHLRTNVSSDRWRKTARHLRFRFSTAPEV
jgi:uncharacterized 2Fe-2S/4Fe-4S cluster protein (DUF4445 family)